MSNSTRISVESQAISPDFWSGASRYPAIMQGKLDDLRVIFCKDPGGARESFIGALVDGVPPSTVLMYWVAVDSEIQDSLLSVLAGQPARIPAEALFALIDCKEFWVLIGASYQMDPRAVKVIQHLFTSDRDRTRQILEQEIRVNGRSRVVVSYWASVDPGIFRYLLDLAIAEPLTSELYYVFNSLLQTVADKGGITTVDEARLLLEKVPALTQTLGQVCISVVANSRNEIGTLLTDRLLLEVFANPKVSDFHRSFSLVQVCKANPEIRPGSPASGSCSATYGPLFEPRAMARALKELSAEGHEDYWRALGYPATAEVTNAVLLALASGMGHSPATELRLKGSMAGVKKDVAFASFSACFMASDANKQSVIKYWLAVSPASLQSTLRDGISMNR